MTAGDSVMHGGDVSCMEQNTGSRKWETGLLTKAPLVEDSKEEEERRKEEVKKYMFR